MPITTTRALAEPVSDQAAPQPAWSLRHGMCSLMASGLLALTSLEASAVNRILDDVTTGQADTALRALVNPTQVGMTEVISGACPSGANEREFQLRCDNFIGFAIDRRASDDGQPWRNAYAGALQQVSPEQFISQGTVATRSAANVIGSRLAALRLGARGFNVAGFGSSQALYGGYLAEAGNGITGGGAGDEEADPLWNRLGIFFNGIGTFGDVDNSTNQVGFDFRSAGVTTGADYRFSENVIAGAAFTYLRMESDFNRNQGALNSDAYSGSLYATYYLPNGFYVDALGTVGALAYDSTRSFAYTLQDSVTGQVTDNVNAIASSSPDGRQYVATLGLGWNHSLGAVNVNPYLRGSYNRLDVDRFNEQGGAGMGLGVDGQSVESVTSVLGAQISYALSTASGVLTPYLRGEWRHEYEDSGRPLRAFFLGNRTTAQSFDIVPNVPDRNYFNVGVGLSGTFAHGVAVFFNYDTLLGYQRITSHAMMAGVRMEF